MRLVLIFNAASAGGRVGREKVIASVAAALRRRGHDVEVIPTEAAGSAGAQARRAAEAGAEVVFACGGDGTAHEVMQGLVGVASTAMGIVPMGSANALARDLGLPLEPVKAALQQMDGEPADFAVGRVEWDGGSRYFAVVAGAGPDGALVYDLATRAKSVLGRRAYDLHALRMLLTRRFPPFAVKYRRVDGGEWISGRAVCSMAVRVRSLGGVFGRVTGSASETGLRLVLVRPPGLISLPLWFGLGWLGLEELNPLIQVVEASEFSCRTTLGPAPHVEADGEWLGRLPMRVSMASAKLRLLRIPRRG